MSETIKELRSLEDEEIVRRHDLKTEHTVVGVAYYLEELARRDAERQLRIIRRLTWAIAAMTLVMTVATVLSAMFVFQASR